MTITLGRYPLLGVRVWSSPDGTVNRSTALKHIVTAREGDNTFILSWCFRTPDEHAAAGVPYPLTITDPEIHWFPEFKDAATRAERSWRLSSMPASIGIGELRSQKTASDGKCRKWPADEEPHRRGRLNGATSNRTPRCPSGILR